MGLDLLKLQPIAKTEEQQQLIDSINSNAITFVVGPAGSGKTFIPTLMGLFSFFSKKYEKLIFSRPCVEANGEKIGFLPR